MKTTKAKQKINEIPDFAPTAAVRRELAKTFKNGWFYFGVDGDGKVYCQFRPVTDKNDKLFVRFGAALHKEGFR